MATARLYSAGDAARALGISLDTLRRWDREGRIRVRDRRKGGGEAGSTDRAPSVGAAADPVRAGDPQGGAAPGGRSHLRQAGPVDARAVAAEARRLRAPGAMRSLFAAVVAVAAAAAVPFLPLPP